jgi:pimeloyl-ACP methyl ester carboxylesterase
MTRLAVETFDPGLVWLRYRLEQPGPRMFAGGAPDMCATIEAEGAYDLTDRLSGKKLPTLVVGGDRDAAYGAALFRENAEGLPNAKLLLYFRTGHVGVQAHRRFVPDVLRFLS